MNMSYIQCNLLSKTDREKRKLSLLLSQVAAIVTLLSPAKMQQVHTEFQPNELDGLLPTYKMQLLIFAPHEIV